MPFRAARIRNLFELNFHLYLHMFMCKRVFSRAR